MFDLISRLFVCSRLFALSDLVMGNTEVSCYAWRMENAKFISNMKLS